MVDNYNFTEMHLATPLEFHQPLSFENLIPELRLAFVTRRFVQPFPYDIDLSDRHDSCRTTACCDIVLCCDSQVEEEIDNRRETDAGQVGRTA